MSGNSADNNPSLLRVFLLFVAGVAVLFSLMAMGIWISTADVLTREKRLINELLPELDAAHQLTAATAGLQSQGFLMRSSESIAQLSRRRDRLNETITEVLAILSTMDAAEAGRLDSLQNSVDDITGVAISLAQVRAQQIALQNQIREQMPEHLVGLRELEKKVQQQVVILTDRLLDTSELMAELEPSNQVNSGRGDVFDRRIVEYESISLSIQDHLLFNQDVISLAGILEKVPLLPDKNSVVSSSQSRDLIVNALASRSIYMSSAENGSELLDYLRDLRTQEAGRQNLFALQDEVLTHEATQDKLQALLREHTDVMLKQTTQLRNESSDIVNTLAKETLSGLDQSRALPIILSVFGLFLLGMVSYWLVYRKTVLPLLSITKQLDDVGTSRFPSVTQNYYLKELSVLSSAVRQLDAAQRNMQVQDSKLQQTNHDLQRANEELQQFAHIASHDLQEPLRKLQQFSDLLVEDYGPKLDKDGRFFLDTIHSSAQRMSVLIKETLAYSRSGSSNQTLVRVDLSRLIQQLRDEMDVAVLEADGVFIIDKMPVVLANELGMAQLFRNLMVNALKYRKPGTPARIQISFDDTGELILIRIEDNGLGIATRYLKKIFIPFERLHGSDVPGTGLGLAICKKVCESHGWSIDVSSEPGVGTSFVVSIPKSSVKG